jgi:Domain of unknown function DUF29
MATRITQPAEDLYEQDFYAWSRRQAELLRAGRFSDLDLGHLAEEVEDLGENIYRSVRSRVRTIVEHLLKLEHSSASEPKRGWRETIRTQRADLDEDLTAALRPRIEAGSPGFYDKARRDAAAALRDYDEPVAADVLPESCPYTLDQIVSDWLPVIGQARGARLPSGEAAMAETMLHRRGTTLVRRLCLAPGEAMPWHTDPFERVTVVLRGDALAIEYRDGGPSERVALAPGQVDRDEPTARVHRAVNVGEQPYEEVTVFFLDRPDAVPQPQPADEGSSSGGAARRIAGPLDQL